MKQAIILDVCLLYATHMHYKDIYFPFYHANASLNRLMLVVFLYVPGWSFSVGAPILSISVRYVS